MDCDRFRFVGAWREVKRYKIIMRASGTNLTWKEGEASIEKIKKNMDKYPEMATFTFYYNTGECIIEVPMYM